MHGEESVEEQIVSTNCSEFGVLINQKFNIPFHGLAIILGLYEGIYLLVII